MIPSARQILYPVIARSVEPRRPLTVSQWADKDRIVSDKQGSKPGQWRTSNNPPLAEPMDCMSQRSGIHEAALMFPIQFGKSEVALNFLGYIMDHAPGPTMVCLPGEVSVNKWIDQKLNPLIDETPAVQRSLVSTKSRDNANRREFKDFNGGQLYMEHAGNPKRLKQTSVNNLLVDELDEFAASTVGGDDPVEMLKGRTSAFPSTYRSLYISTPQMQGTSRIAELWDKSDQRRYHVPCPHCGHEQPLEWSGLHWDPDLTAAWYVCRECAAVIAEHHKSRMIAAGRWVPAHPERRLRGYHINCLYYQLDLGPRWLTLAEQWKNAQGDPAKLKTFINDRLAEPFEDPAMRAVKHNVIADRAEAYALRTAPEGVLEIVAGVDTQDNRLAVQIIGFGIGMTAWTLDYLELPGDPAEAAVWNALVDLLSAPVQHASGGRLRIQACAIDAGGHRTEAVKHFVRSRRVRRPLCIFGAVPNNAPVLSKGKPEDVTWHGRTDRNGVTIHHVGTVGIKHLLYSRLSADAGKPQEARLVHFSEDLDKDFFAGLVSETFNPAKNRFEKRRGGARNEPLDTWVYAYAAAHHPELRLHRRSRADWEAARSRLLTTIGAALPGAPAAVDPAAGTDAAPAPAAGTAARAAVAPPVSRPPIPAPRAPAPRQNSFLRGPRDEH